MFYRWWRKVFSLIIMGLVIIVLVNSAWFLKLFYPFPHEELVVKYTREYRVDPYLVLALIRTESRFYAHARSRVGAKGLMQIMPETGRWIAGQLKIEGFTEDMLFEPQYNIQMGIWYLAYLDNVFRGDTGKMLAAYNAGEHKVKKWLAEGTWSGRLTDVQQIPFSETREYIDRVLFDYQVYKRVYKNKHLLT